MPLLATGTDYVPVFHLGAVGGIRPPFWDQHDEFGDTNMLVSNMEQGRDMTACLADNVVVLMRGHGATVAERTLQLAVFAAIYLQLNAQVISQAMPFGEPIPLTAEEAAGHNAVLASPLAGDRMWEYYCMRAGVAVC